MQKTAGKSIKVQDARGRVLARTLAEELRLASGGTDGTLDSSIIQTGGPRRDLSDTDTEMDFSWE